MKIKIQQIRKNQSVALLAGDSLEKFLDANGYSVGAEELSFVKDVIEIGEAYCLEIDTYGTLIRFIISKV